MAVAPSLPTGAGYVGDGEFVPHATPQVLVREHSSWPGLESRMLGWPALETALRTPHTWPGLQACPQRICMFSSKGALCPSDMWHVRSVSCGDEHCAATTTCGRVFTWGVGRCEWQCSQSLLRPACFEECASSAKRQPPWPKSRFLPPRRNGRLGHGLGSAPELMPTHVHEAYSYMLDMHEGNLTDSYNRCSIEAVIDARCGACPEHRPHRVTLPDQN